MGKANKSVVKKILILMRTNKIFELLHVEINQKKITLTYAHAYIYTCKHPWTSRLLYIGSAI